MFTSTELIDIAGTSAAAICSLYGVDKLSANEKYEQLSNSQSGFKKAVPFIQPILALLPLKMVKSIALTGGRYGISEINAENNWLLQFSVLYTKESFNFKNFGIYHHRIDGSLRCDGYWSDAASK